MSPGEWAMLFANLKAVTAQNREELAAAEALMENADAVMASEYQKAMDKAKPGVAEQILPTVAGAVAAPFTAGMSIPAAMAVTGGAVAAGHAGGQLIDKGRVNAGRALTAGAISGATAGLNRGLDKGLDWLGNKAATMKEARVAEGQKLAGVEEGFETETGLGAAAKVKEMMPKAGFKERLYSALSNDASRDALSRAVDNIAMQYLRPGAPDVAIPRGLRPQTQLAIQQQRMEQQQMADQAAYQQEMLGLQQSELGLREREMTQRGELAEAERTHREKLAQMEIDARAEADAIEHQQRIEEANVRGMWEERGRQDELEYMRQRDRLTNEARVDRSGGQRGSGGTRPSGYMDSEIKAISAMVESQYPGALVYPGEDGQIHAQIPSGEGRWIHTIIDVDPNTGNISTPMVGGEGAPSTPGTQRPPTAEDLVRRVLPPGSPAPESPSGPAPESPSGPIPVRTPEEKQLINVIDEYTRGELKESMLESTAFLPGSKYTRSLWGANKAKSNLRKVAMWRVKGGRATPISLSELKAIAAMYNMKVDEFIDAVVKGDGLVYGRDKENEQYHNTRYAIYGSPLYREVVAPFLEQNPPIGRYKARTDVPMVDAYDPNFAGESYIPPQGEGKPIPNRWTK